jgi:hypothetical protein
LTNHEEDGISSLHRMTPLTQSPAPVTVVVLPRERFGLTETSLELLYEHTPKPFELIFVDPNSPRRIRDYLERQAHAKGFRILRVDHFLPSPQMRNLALRETKTPYVVFIENDVIVRAGWLDALRSCAEETGAPIVGPLYLEQAAQRQVVHMAGGVLRLDDFGRQRRCTEIHRFQGSPLCEVAHALRRQPTDLIEFHCVLIRADVVRQLGGFDEGMKNTAEHVDFCLSMRAAGHQIYFEPRAVVVYMQPPPFQWSDVRFFCTRWNDTWARQTIAHFAHKWRLDPDDPFLANKRTWTTVRRRQILNYFWAQAPIPQIGRRIAQRFFTPTFDTCIAKVIARPRT